MWTVLVPTKYIICKNNIVYFSRNGDGRMSQLSTPFLWPTTRHGSKNQRGLTETHQAYRMLVGRLYTPFITLWRTLKYVSFLPKYSFTAKQVLFATIAHSFCSERSKELAWDSDLDTYCLGVRTRDADVNPQLVCYQFISKI